MEKIGSTQELPNHLAQVMPQFPDPSAKFTGRAVRGKKGNTEIGSKGICSGKTLLQTATNSKILGLLFIASSINLSEEISDSQHKRFPFCISGICNWMQIKLFSLPFYLYFQPNVIEWRGNSRQMCFDWMPFHGNWDGSRFWPWWRCRGGRKRHLCVLGGFRFLFKLLLFSDRPDLGSQPRFQPLQGSHTWAAPGSIPGLIP